MNSAIIKFAIADVDGYIAMLPAAALLVMLIFMAVKI